MMASSEAWKSFLYEKNGILRSNIFGFFNYDPGAVIQIIRIQHCSHNSAIPPVI
jgi:hypothetical protein